MFCSPPRAWNKTSLCPQSFPYTAFSDSKLYNIPFLPSPDRRPGPHDPTQALDLILTRGCLSSYDIT